MTEHELREASFHGLASRLKESGALTSDWLPAFAAVPRELFVPDLMWPGQTKGTGQGEAIDRSEDPEAWFHAVYSDVSLTTQWDDGQHSGTGKGRTPTCCSMGQDGPDFAGASGARGQLRAAGPWSRHRRHHWLSAQPPALWAPAPKPS